MQIPKFYKKNRNIFLVHVRPLERLLLLLLFQNLPVPQIWLLDSITTFWKQIAHECEKLSSMRVIGTLHSFQNNFRNNHRHFHRLILAIALHLHRRSHNWKIVLSSWRKIFTGPCSHSLHHRCSHKKQHRETQMDLLTRFSIHALLSKIL